jgi:hypothetical protein
MILVNCQMCAIVVQIRRCFCRFSTCTATVVRCDQVTLLQIWSSCGHTSCFCSWYVPAHMNPVTENHDSFYGLIQPRRNQPKMDPTRRPAKVLMIAPVAVFAAHVHHARLLDDGFRSSTYFLPAAVNSMPRISITVCPRLLPLRGWQSISPCPNSPAGEAMMFMSLCMSLGSSLGPASLRRESKETFVPVPSS